MNRVLETLRRDFDGDVIEPGGAQYDSASGTVLATGNPGLVRLPTSARDVVAAVKFAATAGLVPSERGGGQGFAGFDTNDGAAVTDLGELAHFPPAGSPGGRRSSVSLWPRITSQR